ncbi:MAG: substrate-binding domain-containing protein [Bryobacteraceae bacterium]|nr:substrate-binding domain-containing protein [Bryobacteraceae bacterium]
MPRSHLTRRALLASAGTAAVALSGCHRSSQRTVGMVPKGSSNLFWQTVHAGALKAAREFKFNLEWNAPSLETDSSRQVEIVESMINRRLAGLILAPVDRKALAGVVDKAAVQNVPTVIFDSAIDSDKMISYVATDNLAGGRLAARRLGEVLAGKGKVAILGFMLGSASTMEREQGFQQELAKSFPGIAMVDLRFSNSDRSVAMALAENIMTAHPDLGGFFADNEGSSTGAARALKSRNAKHIKLVAFDTTPQLIDDLRTGWLDSIVVQAPFAMGYKAAEAMGLHLQGKKPLAHIDSGVRLIRSSDLEAPDVKELLNPDLKPYLGNRGAA